MKLDECRYFGVSTISNYIENEEINVSPNTQVFHKFIKNNCVYQTNRKSLYKSNNTFALTNNDEYVQLLEFLVDRENYKELTVCRRVIIDDAFSQICRSTKKVVNIEQNATVIIETNSIERICIYMEVCNEKYICSVPTMQMYS